MLHPSKIFLSIIKVGARLKKKNSTLLFFIFLIESSKVDDVHLSILVIALKFLIFFSAFKDVMVEKTAQSRLPTDQMAVVEFTLLLDIWI